MAFVVFASWWIGLWFGIFGEQLCPAPSQQKDYRGEAQDSADKAKSSGVFHMSSQAAIDLPQLHASETAQETERSQNCSYYRPVADWWFKFVDFKISDALIVFFTGILAYKTSGLDRATRGLQRAASQQGIDTAKAIAESARAATAMESSLDIARQPVDASLDATRTAREMGEATIRAYVFVQNIFFSISANNRPCVRVEWKNSGQTPAKNVKLTTNFTLGTTVIGDKEQPVKYTDSSIKFAKDVGSQDPDFAEIHFTCVIPPQHAGGQSATPATVFVQGDITFRDVFGSTIKEPFAFNFICKARTTLGNPAAMERLPVFDGESKLI